MIFVQIQIENTPDIVRSNIKHVIYVLFSFILLVLIHKYFTYSNCQYKYKLAGYKFFFLVPFNNDIKIPTLNVEEKCYYEFFEGLYEASAFSNDRYKNLDYVCSEMNLRLPKATWNQCYFMLGTAISYTERSEISTPDDLQKFIDSKISFCEGANKNYTDCFIGVYTGVHIAYQNFYGDSKFPIKNNDPFWLCRVGKGLNNKSQCMRNIVSYIYEFTDKDLDKAILFIKSNPEDSLVSQDVLITFFSSLAFKSEISMEEIQKTCVSYADMSVRNACILGYANGVVESYVYPESLPRSVEYCLSPLFNYQESGECLKVVFYDLPLETPIEDCLKNTPEIYWKYCNEIESRI